MCLWAGNTLLSRTSNLKNIAMLFQARGRSMVALGLGAANTGSYVMAPRDHGHDGNGNVSRSSASSIIPMLEQLEPRLLLSAGPNMDFVRINGTVVSPGETVPMIMPLGSSFELWLAASNRGEDSPADCNDIAVSFPQFTSSADQILVDVKNRSSDLGLEKEYGPPDWGMSPFDNGRGDGYADYVLIEAYDTDDWLAGEANYLVLDVEPKAYGAFEIRFRVSMSDRESSWPFWFGWVDDPSTSSQRDCTNLPVYSVTIDVIPPWPPPVWIRSIAPDPAQPPSENIFFDGEDTNGLHFVEYEWRSDLDGLLHQSQSLDFTRSSYQMTVGTHEISLRGRFPDGFWSPYDTENLTIRNALPTATIDTPGIVELNETVVVHLGGHDNDENGDSIVGGRLRIRDPLANWFTVIQTSGQGNYSFLVSEVGQYLLEYSVQDDEGTWSASPVSTLNAVDTSPPWIETWSDAGWNEEVGGEEIRITFSEPVNDATFTAEDVSVVPDSLFMQMPVKDISRMGGKTFRVVFESIDMAVDYYITIGPAIEDLAENSMRSAYHLVLDRMGPGVSRWYSAAEHGALGEVALAIPDDGSFSEPRNGGIRTLLVEFSEAINPASFTPASVQFAGIDIDGNDVDLSGIDITVSTRDGDTVGVIEFSETLPDAARYIVRVEGVTDAAGNPLIGDNDRIMTALIGDATGDLRVNSTDLSLVHANRANPIDSGLLNEVRSDVFTDGRVNSTDLSAVWGNRHDARFIPDPVLTLGMAAFAPSGITTPSSVEKLSVENVAPLALDLPMADVVSLGRPVKSESPDLLAEAAILTQPRTKDVAIASNAFAATPVLDMNILPVVSNAVAEDIVEQAAVNMWSDASQMNALSPQVAGTPAWQNRRDVLDSDLNEGLVDILSLTLLQDPLGV